MYVEYEAQKKKKKKKKKIFKTIAYLKKINRNVWPKIQNADELPVVEMENRHGCML